VEGLNPSRNSILISHLEDQLLSKTAAGLQAPEGSRLVDIWKTPAIFAQWGEIWRKFAGEPRSLEIAHTQV